MKKNEKIIDYFPAFSHPDPAFSSADREEKAVAGDEEKEGEENNENYNFKAFPVFLRSPESWERKQ